MGFKNGLMEGTVVSILSRDMFIEEAATHYRVVDADGKSSTFPETDLVLDEDISKLLFI